VKFLYSMDAETTDKEDWVSPIIFSAQMKNVRPCLKTKQKLSVRGCGPNPVVEHLHVWSSGSSPQYYKQKQTPLPAFKGFGNTIISWKQL
jgi:hypothetical protein